MPVAFNPYFRHRDRHKEKNRIIKGTDLKRRKGKQPIKMDADANACSNDCWGDIYFWMVMSCCLLERNSNFKGRDYHFYRYNLHIDHTGRALHKILYTKVIPINSETIQIS